MSNESPQDVFFDNITVQHHRGPLLEEDHYYPFGLSMSGISAQAAGKPENLLKYNKGSELQHKEFSDGSGLDSCFFGALTDFAPILRWIRPIIALREKPPKVGYSLFKIAAHSEADLFSHNWRRRASSPSKWTHLGTGTRFCFSSK